LVAPPYFSGPQAIPIITPCSRYASAATENPALIVLSQEELQRFFSVIQKRQHPAMFKTMYGAGLRASELISLRVEDVDSTRDTHVAAYPGRQGTKATLCQVVGALLEVMREYYKVCRPSSPVKKGSGCSKNGLFGVENRGENRRAGVFHRAAMPRSMSGCPASGKCTSG